ncbi:hypothetical protein BD310DRAFT_542804 [Dichomitus squalens]|uniref:Uncharacterized protein n=1 Tax=Dichomitus squalens TaxID=114155 RepID=A0A4Q9PT26_9APHY|nr:hypothetical protein BD310DRAFT_542804 [Dichomitus squalens]
MPMWDRAVSSTFGNVYCCCTIFFGFSGFNGDSGVGLYRPSPCATHCAADATAHHIKHWLADAAASYSARPVTPLYRSQSTRAYVPRASCWQTTICFRLWATAD